MSGEVSPSFRKVMSARPDFELPIIPHHEADAGVAEVRAAESLAEGLARESPELTPSDSIRRLIPRHLVPAPALHLDDLSGIPGAQRFSDVTYLEDRARFRAGEGDFVATCSAAVEGFEDYCAQELGLGRVTWLHPLPRGDPLAVAAACWTDVTVREALQRAVSGSRLALLHPHLGNRAVWNVAYLLRRSEGRELHVVAPHPRLADRVNDKVWFTDAVQRLFGQPFTPRSAHAHNFATLAMAARQLAEEAHTLVVKVPNSQGGAGNYVFDAAHLRGRPAGEIRGELRTLLKDVSWTGTGHLLVSSWESDVLSSPSSQLWIPPEWDGLPVVEGLFEQRIAPESGAFLGSRPAALPRGLERECVNRSWLLGRVFQRLGYVGRCSFDLLLVGERLATARVEFIECNGRWGGTSGPMTLMNRLVGDWHRRHYGTRMCWSPVLRSISFSDLLDLFRDDLFDIRSGTGRVVFFNPGAMRGAGRIDALAMGSSPEEVHRLLDVEIPRRLRRSAGWRTLRDESAAPAARARHPP